MILAPRSIIDKILTGTMEVVLDLGFREALA
jgi:hypothetical protein